MESLRTLSPCCSSRSWNLERRSTPTAPLVSSHFRPKVKASLVSFRSFQSPIIHKTRRTRLLRVIDAVGDLQRSSKDSQEEENGTLRFGDELRLTTSNVSGSPSSTLRRETRTVCITIHGLHNDEEVNRLKTMLETVDGIAQAWIGELLQGGPREGYVTVQLELQNEFTLLQVTRSVQALDPSKLLVLPFKMNSWNWRNYNIKFGVAGCGKPVILVHGFGGNAGHFANLISYLADDYKVYAIDLLGFGASDKPTQLDYSPDLWAELVCDFAQEFTPEGTVLVGNSIGSLTALTAAAKCCKDTIRGLVLLNCAGAMNRKGLTQDGLILRLLSPVFVAVEYLLSKPRIANLLFNRFRNKDNIRKILTEQAYKNPEAVTDQLVDILYHPSIDDGAVDVFVKVFTGDNPGSRPEKLMEQVDVPVLVLWGDRDAWTPVNGPVANFFKKLATERADVQLYALKDVGHCPHDDRPELAAEYILEFLQRLPWSGGE